MAEVKKKCLGLALHCGNGEGEIKWWQHLATCFHPLLTPACFSGASSPARPATPSVPCSSTTPPPPPPRPPSRPKLPPGKPGVGDVVCSLLPWLAQKLMVSMTNRSEKPPHGPSLLRVQASGHLYKWPWQVASERHPQTLPSSRQGLQWEEKER